jgi:DNA polymerase sigma
MIPMVLELNGPFEDIRHNRRWALKNHRMITHYSACHTQLQPLIIPRGNY